MNNIEAHKLEGFSCDSKEGCVLISEKEELSVYQNRTGKDKFTNTGEEGNEINYSKPLEGSEVCNK